MLLVVAFGSVTPVVWSWDAITGIVTSLPENPTVLVVLFVHGLRHLADGPFDAASPAFADILEGALIRQ